MMESRFQPVILASQSPRRKELLARIFSDFQVCPAHADESLTPGFTPKQNVACLAQRKAQAVAQHSDCQALIIASDTIVVCDDVILGKPENEADAVRMLRALSGRTHQVMTAVCVKTPERELTRAEYARLLAAAQSSGDTRLALLMESICATGIRVSEVKFLTVEAAQCGRAEIALKGKIRTILLPAKLCRKLLKYAKQQKTASGEIFLTRSGKSLSRKQIWAEMKGVCRAAGVAPSKVFPHNLRHLFARIFYRVCRDVVKLADVLGHSSIETTRIYLISTGAEHAGILRKMRLIL